MGAILKQLKLLLKLQGNEEDSILKALITSAIEWVEVECNLIGLDVEDIPQGLKSVIVDMAIFRYTILGKEGISSEKIVDLSYSYLNDYPDYILRRLKRFRRIILR